MTEEKTTETPQKEAVNPIAELFWPKEMKELVKKYRAEGTCNEEAVKIYKKQIYAIFIFGVVFLLLLTTGGLAVYWYLIFASISPILVRVITSRYVNRYIIPYTVGKKEKGKVQFVKKDIFGVDAAYGKFFLGYEHNNKQFTLKHITRKERSNLESQGDYIDIMVNPYNSKYNIPYFQEWNKKYNLNHKTKG